MAKSAQISLAIIALAQTGSAYKACREPARKDCVEPFLHAEDGSNDPDFSWNLWKSRHNKTYGSDEEDGHRKKVWTKNTIWMMQENDNPHHKFTLGWHSHSDLTEDEFRQFRGLNYKKNASVTGKLGTTHRGLFHYEGKLQDLPSDWDWSTSDTEVVTYVKEQHCGDCWAFSAAGGLEGALAVANGWTTSLSPQQFVDCAANAGNCDGGAEEQAMLWAKDNFACSWDSYPETGSQGNCNWNCHQVITAGSIWGTYWLTAGDEGSMCAGLMQRPITVGVAADDKFGNYGGGILDYRAKGNKNHAVLAVGYGYWNGAGYWKIKNSWGTSWGIGGYVLLARGNGKNQNDVLDVPIGVVVYGPYNPSMVLTDVHTGERFSPPTSATVV